MTSRRQRRRDRAGAQSVASVQKYKPPFPLNLLSSQVAFYVIGLLAIVGSLFFFFGSTFDNDPNANEDIIDITPEEDAEVDPDNPDATATEEAQEIRQFESQPGFTIDGAVDYQAVITTDAGEFTIDLLEAESPVAVNNFVFLARENFYAGQSFFRVIPDFVAQTGDPTGIGTGGPGYSLDLSAAATATPEATASPGEDEETPEEDAEATEEATPEDATPEASPTVASGPEIDLTEGVVAMAFDNRLGAISGSQFFIVLASQLDVDAEEYVAFGRVLEGLDVLELLTARDPQANPNAPEGDEIISIEIIEA